MQPSEFIKALYGDSTGHLVLWRNDTKVTTWIKDCNANGVNIYAENAKKTNHNAYFGACLQGKKAEKKHSRGTKAATSIMPGLWVDIDYKSDRKTTGQKKPKKYPTEAVAKRAVSLMPFEPSITIATGGGVHCYWLFDEPLKLDNSNRLLAEGLSQKWQAKLKALLLRLDAAELDSTHDLARVMRLPGTPHTGVPGFIVKVDSFGGDAKQIEDVPRYRFDDLYQSVFDQAVPKTQKNLGSVLQDAKESVESGQIYVPSFALPDVKPVFADENSQPPGMKLHNLCEAIPAFRRVFDCKGKISDRSDYDMILCNYAINAGWTPQEAAGLLIQFAHKHNKDHLPKILREVDGYQDYLHRTIGKAYDKSRLDERSQQADQAVERIAQVITEDSEAAETADSEGIDHRSDIKHGECLKYLSVIFGVRVLGWKQTGIEAETFSLMVQVGSSKREIVIGSASDFASSPAIGVRRFKARIYAEANRVMKITKKLLSEWDSILGMLGVIVEIVEIKEATLKERAVGIVREHIARSQGAFLSTKAATIKEHISNNNPYLSNGVLHVSSTSLHVLTETYDKTLTRTKLANAMLQAGFARNSRLHGTGGTTRSYWVIPLDDLEGFEMLKHDELHDPDAEGKVKLFL